MNNIGFKIKKDDKKNLMGMEEKVSRERFEDGDEIYVVVFRLNYVVF
jgi:hypothetical protein